MRVLTTDQLAERDEQLMREELSPEASDTARRIWPHFLEARGEGFRVLWNRLCREGPEVMRTAYQEVRQWRAQSFGWLEIEDFNRALDELRRLDDSSSTSCRARRRKRKEGGYPPPDVEKEAPRFGPVEQFADLYRVVADTTPDHAGKMLEAATTAEVEQLLEADIAPLLSHDEPQTRRAALFALAHMKNYDGDVAPPSPPPPTK